MTKDEALKMAIEVLKKLLHFLPLVHFYEPWKDRDIYGGYDRQTTNCSVCRKKKNRIESATGGLM